MQSAGGPPDVISEVKKLSEAPESEDAFNSWIGQKDAVPFLRNNARRQEIIMDLSTKSAFIHAVVVPNANVNPPDVDDLMCWELSPWSSWGVTVHYSDGTPATVSIEEPMGGTNCKSFLNGERLVFHRAFEGRQGEKRYCEVLQKFSHAFELHFLAERNCYCRLDRSGDIEDVIRVIEIPGRGARPGISAVTFNRAVLDEYLAITDSALVIAFDFTRVPPKGFRGWDQVGQEQKVVEDDIFYRSHIEPGHASYMRGVQIVHSAISADAVIRDLDSQGEKPREYASFVAWDFKNKVIREISTAPGAIANYFTDSNLPFETSPAFFRPEVLLKYKSDSDKYRLQDRSISCRNAWSLQSYDINEAGQVHTYLIYLQRLPYDEQLYWKSHNEAPKASISKRAFTTDFEGNWYNEYDPLASLKGILTELDQIQVPWWALRSEELLSRVHYPVTASPDEWSNEILQLHQILVEGFETKWLRKKAVELGRNSEPKLGSLKLIEQCLIGFGFEEEEARKVTAPMHGLHWLRSVVKAHAPTDEVWEVRKRVLTQHGNYAAHFRALCAECDEGVRMVAEQFSKCGLK